MEEIKLAGLQLPPGLDASTIAVIKGLAGEAFVFGFRLVMLICAGLSVAGSVIASLLIPKSQFAPSLAHLTR